jgi:hypothetical protein
VAHGAAQVARESEEQERQHDRDGESAGARAGEEELARVARFPFETSSALHAV